jgi:uncharacterized protein YfaS (alpha-2-macroglobulin family)
MLRVLAATVCVLASFACRPQARLGDGPPSITDKTKVLATFDPAALADASATGFDPAAAENGPPKPPEPNLLPDPAVVDHGPTAEASEYPTLQIRFNRPMVPLGEKVYLSAEEAGFEITPKIEGEAYWAEPTRLVFQPESALPPAHEYTVRFQRRIESVDGPPLDVSLNWKFATAPPSVSMSAHYEDQMDGGREYHWKARVDVDVSQDISLAELRRHLTASARDSNGKTAPVEVAVRELRRDKHGYRPYAFEITPKTRWPADAEIVLRVGKGLRGKVGPRSMADPYAYSFSTPAGVMSHGIVCVEGQYEDGCELGPVLVSFTAPVSRARAKLLSVSPKPKHLDVLAVDRLTDERGRERDAYGSVMLWGEFERGVTYEISIDERLQDVHGQPLIGSLTDTVEFVEPPPSLALLHAWGSFIQSRGAKLGIEGRHVETLRVRVAELDEKTYESMRGEELEVWPAEVKATSDLHITPAQLGAWGWSAHELDLSQITGGRPAALLVEVSAVSLLPRAAGRAMPPTRIGLVQITELGVTAVGSLPGGVVRVARLHDDAPVAGASIELIEAPGGTREVIGKTDADGLLRLPPATELPDTALLRARAGNDRVVLDARTLAASSTGDDLLKNSEEVRTTLMTERPLYKPGERVRAMGWAAIATPYELSGLRRIPPKTRVTLEIRDHRNEVIASRTVTSKSHGKFWATLDIPQSAALGHYTLLATLLGGSTTTGLRVEDYPIPEFEVSAAATRSDLHGGESTTISVDANYYFGGRVPIQRARHATECDEIDFRPPGLEPSWSVAPRHEWGDGYGRMGRASIGLRLGPGSERGHLEYEITPREAMVSHPLRCKHSIAVGDATEREIGAEAVLWVHPNFYLAARAPSSLEHGDDATVEIATLDFDGSPLEVDDVTVSLVRSWSEPEYVTENGQKRFIGSRSRNKKLPDCKLSSRFASAQSPNPPEAKLSSEGTAACKFSKLEHGSYEISVRAKQGGQETILEDWLWVREADDQAWTFVPPAQLEIAVDRPTPRVGDKIRARVQAPWSSGRALVLLTKGGMHELHTVTLAQGSATLELEVADAWIPWVELQVLAIEPGDAKHTPQLRHESTKVTVDASSRELAVDVVIPSEAQTGEQLPIAIAVRDAAGKPVRGHVSVWAVDEAVLSLAPLELPNFVERFSVALWTGLHVLESYSELLLPYASRPDDYVPRDYEHGWASGGLSLVGSGYGGGGAGAGSIGLGNTGLIGHGGGAMPRSNFSSAPIFIGDAQLDADGRAQLTGELPDNLTTFRLTAVASAPLGSPPRIGDPVEARFGTGDARVRVTRPLVVRAALPRILRPGDQAEVGVLVDNLRGTAGTLDVAVTLHDADGALELLGKTQATSIQLAAGEQIRVPFTIRALGVGTPQFEVQASLKGDQGATFADALRLPLPVEAERTLTDRVAVYGSLDDDGAAVLPFAIPADADPRFGGLSVSVSPTLLGGLEDAVDYLVRYPYGCLEQTSSSLLPLIPLGRLAAQGYPLGIVDVDDHVDSGIARLRSMQLPGGGFSYWPGGTEPAPYASAYATWVLTRARGAGYRVPDAMLSDADSYLLGQVQGWASRTAPALGEDIEMSLILMTLAERGHIDDAALGRLYERRRRLPVFAQAMLLLALGTQDPRVPELQRELLSLVDEREAVAKIETDATHTWYWDSDPRSSAIVLIAMLRSDPQHPLVSKLTRGLLETRRGGRWSNTQENAWALLALADYAAVYEADAPDFDGRVWLGNDMLASIHVEGRAYEFKEGFTAMDELLGTTKAASAANDPLLLERAGRGRMYYRVGLEWASTATDKPAKAEGIRIARTLRSEAGLVGEDQAVTAGDLIALDVDIEITSALDYVALEIPLPAGLEAINLDLGKGTGAMKLSGNRGSWVSHQELRRDRAVLFADHIEPGKYRTTVALRATTPGEYVMPAGHAHMMYYPEVYGRTTARRLLVR